MVVKSLLPSTTEKHKGVRRIEREKGRESKMNKLSGGTASCAGWVGIIIATATHDWVRTCEYTVTTCLRMDELGSRGLWAECVISPSLYHCVTLTQILTLPAYIQVCRALMVFACLTGLPALGLVMMSMPCVRLEEEIPASKRRRAMVGGTLLFVTAICGLVSTIWFPIGAHQEEGLMSFGPSLYAGWVGSVLCLLGSFMILYTCCNNPSAIEQRQDNSCYYYSREAGGAATPISAAATIGVSAMTSSCRP
ncbi:hypothetical protein UPYG_G00074080 [Umbra pygmaea]|uniref:Claudin n=1 Tax=Umbra pygmaea TaxID=75934 RepID=A0ABD0Y1T9_UMBPY